MTPFDAAAETKKRAQKHIKQWKLKYGTDGRLDYYGTAVF